MVGNLFKMWYLDMGMSFEETQRYSRIDKMVYSGDNLFFLFMSTDAPALSNFYSNYITVNNLSSESLPTELVKSSNNEKTSFGPEFRSAGAYHITKPFLKDNANYNRSAKLTR
jgi:hypothetical protein